MPNIMIELDGCNQKFREGFLAALDWLDGADFTLQVGQHTHDRSWVMLTSSDNDGYGDRTYEVDHKGQVHFKEFGAVL